jgi:AhpD family alkylhydroperoxidase
LPPDLIDLVYLRVSQINGCAYCIDMHTRDLLKRDLAIDKVALCPSGRRAAACSMRASARRSPGPRR